MASEAPEPDNPDELRARALRLLARREHSRAELRRKLGIHAGSGEALDAVLDGLESKRQLSDERFAGERAHALTRRFGAARIRQDLKAHGVDDATALRLASAASATDLERARAIYERRYRAPATTREERAKRTRFLQGRGFPQDVIRTLLSAGKDE